MRPPISKRNAPSFKHAALVSACVCAPQRCCFWHVSSDALPTSVVQRCVRAFVVKVVTQRSLTDSAADVSCAVGRLNGIRDAYSLVWTATSWFIYYLRSYLYA